MYKNILSVQMAQYNKIYKAICKSYPAKSIKDKQDRAFIELLKLRGISESEQILETLVKPFEDCQTYQYIVEVALVKKEVQEGITRFYIKDESLFDFFKNTELKKKEILSILKETKDYAYGIIGTNFSCTVQFTHGIDNRTYFTMLTDTMNYSFCAEEYESNKNENRWVFNLAMNFLFYINAFPECVLDGVPQGVKHNPTAKSISVSEKIVSHTTVEHGFVRPHFRSGYFRHLNSDYFVNCKGQVRFIASTMVKGKAKTVISKG